MQIQASNATLNSEPVIVVGAGWAGLAAALQLSRADTKVILLEAAPQAGGRARAVTFGNDIVDNGQHLLIGAYQHTLQLLKWLKISEDSVLYRTPLALNTIDFKNPLKTTNLTLSKLPPKLQLLAGILNASGYSVSERLKAMQFGKTIFQKSISSLLKPSKDFEQHSDITIKELLALTQQPASLIHKLWEPIALAALSTPIEIASAAVFLEVLKNVFTQNASHSNWLMTKTDLSQLLPNPILKHLQEQGSQVFYHQRVQKLLIENDQCVGVTTASHTYRGKTVILATPPHVTAELLESYQNRSVSCQHLRNNLLKFQYQPITTVYLRYPKAVQLPFPMVGLLNSTLQWVFDRKIAAQPNILSGIITGLGTHSVLNHEALGQKIIAELSHFFPHLGHPVDFRVITEKRAAFSCELGITAYRPPNQTPIQQLCLAGDYTQTSLPATLEGAIQSGIKAAQLILFRDAVLL